MKIQNKLLLAVLILPFLMSALYSQPLRLKGVWEGKTQKGEEIKLTFGKNGEANLFRAQSGRYYSQETAAIFQVKCSLDTTVTPYQFDLFFYGESVNRGILYKNDKDSLTIYFAGYNEERLKKPDDENLYETWSMKIVKK